MKSSDDLTSFVRDALNLSISDFIGIESLPVRGSDRSFFRVKLEQKDSFILIHYNPERLENTYYADIALFLHNINIPVPLMVSHDPIACFMLIEDMGNRDLWSLRDASREIRQEYYRKTLMVVHRLHAFTENDFSPGNMKLMNGFDYDLYCWEHEYFKEHFVKGVCGLEAEQCLWHELEAELTGLARRLIGTKRALIHRDLQSQNVMIRDEEPFLIDFQGMRFGNPLYDLGSLLYDPYVTIPEDEILDLLFFYYNMSEQTLDWCDFQNAFQEASAQRLMQALGAYGFLGMKKGMKTFLDYIPAGIMKLCNATLHTRSLQNLKELSGICQKLVDQKNILVF